MTTTVEQELKDCISQLNEAEQQSILQLIKTFLLDRQQTADSTSIEDYNKELNEAEAERGEFITHEEMLKKMKKERISVEQYNQEIGEALADIERGETYSHEEVVKMAKEKVLDTKM